MVRARVKLMVRLRVPQGTDLNPNLNQKRNLSIVSKHVKLTINFKIFQKFRHF